jgi:CheY-like chemotaxis protein
MSIRAVGKRGEEGYMARILIVDDTTDMRELLKNIVELAGHQVVEADSGRAGLERFKAQPADVVMTDIIMPDMDGNELIAKLRALDPKVKIVAVSGGGRVRNLGVLQVAQKFGADRVLSKPFRKEDVLRVVDELLKGAPRAGA